MTTTTTQLLDPPETEAQAPSVSAGDGRAGKVPVTITGLNGLKKTYMMSATVPVRRIKSKLTRDSDPNSVFDVTYGDHGRVLFDDETLESLGVTDEGTGLVLSPTIQSA